MSRVLMTDDAGLFQMLEGSFLRRLGCEIIRVSEGRDVAVRARLSSPDLILLDADHPRIDGPSCVREIKSDPLLRDTPVLVVSSADNVALCCAAGAEVTLARPLARGALELALGSLGRIGQRVGARRSGRFSARITATGAARRCRVKDISLSGLFLSLPDPPPLQAHLVLFLRLPGSERRRTVRAIGEVVRQVGSDPESHLIPGVGVRFVGLDEATAAIIERYVDGATGGADRFDPETREEPPPR